MVWLCAADRRVMQYMFYGAHLYNWNQSQGRAATLGRSLPLAIVRNLPILLKKSALVSMTEKYAPEFEILTFSRGLLTRILRSSVQKRCFHPLVFEHFGETDFFNSICQKRTITGRPFGTVRPHAKDDHRPNPGVRRFKLQWQGREDEEPSFCPRAPCSKWTADRIGLRVRYRLKVVD